MPDNPFAAPDVGELYARAARSIIRVHSRASARSSVTSPSCVHSTSRAARACRRWRSPRTPRLSSVSTLSPEMLRAARPADGVTYVLANAERLPLPPGVVDAVTCCSGVHWFDQARFFAELARVLRPRGWVGLYDHYFLGEMVDVPAFADWTRDALDRYPLPPRNPQVGDPRASTPEGFDNIGEELFADNVEMTHHAFADYQLTISNFVAAAERGSPRAVLRRWLLDSTAPLFEGVSTRTLRFLGSIICLRHAEEPA